MPNGERAIPVADLYRNDGIDYLTRQRDELLTAVHLPRATGGAARTGSCGGAARSIFRCSPRPSPSGSTADGTVEAARIVLGAVASCPVEATDAAAALVGGSRSPTQSIAGAADLAAHPARPMDNTDFSLLWRKRMVRDFVTYALREVRGDDVRELRRRVSRARSC